jgi:general secretion pathway protein G
MLKRTTTTAVAAARQPRGGFTLMEMMVVVAIIIILLGISVPLVINYWNNSKIDATKARLRTVQTAAQTYEMATGQQVTDLTQLTQMSPDGRQPTIRPQDLVDAWNNQIVIEGRDPSTNQLILMSQGMPGSNHPLRSTDP